MQVRHVAGSAAGNATLTRTWLACFAFTAWFAVVFWAKVRMLHHGILLTDIYMFANSIVNTHPLDGEILFSAIQAESRGFVSILQDHFSPILLLFTPFPRVFGPDALLLFLMAVQTAGPLVLAGILYGQLCRLSSKAGSYYPLLAALAYLCNPGTVLACLDSAAGFHQDSLYPIAIGALFFAMLNRRRVLSILSLVGLFLIKENAVLYALPASLVGLVLDRDRWRRSIYGWMLGLSVVGGATALVGSPYFFRTQNAYVKSGLSRLGWENAGNVLWLLRSHWPGYLLLLWPALLFPAVILVILPDLGVFTFFKINAKDWHDFPVLAVFACAAALAGLGYFDRARNRWTRPVLVLTALAGILLGAKVGSDDYRKAMRQRIAISDSEVAAAAALVPFDCPVGADDRIMQHFVDRPTLLYVRQGRAAAYLVLVEPMKPEDAQLLGWSGQTAFQPVGRSGRISVFRNPAVSCPAPYRRTIF
ncbi:MAG TPA: DUF2079 domain-containing protein [Stellaceae bacterium]|nr:DUF2079 domain-containing protein [Stellaceae bacterium]